MPIELTVNGDPRIAPEGHTILALLGELGLDPARVAVELNRSIVKQKDWAGTVITTGSRVEIVQFVGGG